MRNKKVLTAASIAVVMLMVLSVTTFASSSTNESGGSEAHYVPTFAEGSYGAYLNTHNREVVPNKTIDIPLDSLTVAENVTYENVDGRTNVLVTGEDSVIEFKVDVPVTGMYSIGVDYHPIKGSGSAIERKVQINGEYPFTEANSIGLDRIFRDDVDDINDYDSYFTQDSNGNQVRKAQVEHPIWVDESAFRDSSSAYNGALKFYLEKGVNTINLQSVRGGAAFSRISIYGDQDPEDYDDFLMNNVKYQFDGSELIQQIEAECPSSKSDPVLFASYDRASSATSPASVDTIKLNTIGGNTTGDPRWSVVGQWIEYKVTVPETGLYKIAMRARQNTVNGGFVSREISINGKIQYTEASNIKIAYDSDWQMVVPKTDFGDDLLFKLEKGENTIRIKAVTGKMGDIINGVETVISKLNEDYRNILMITGSSPDEYRDYNFAEEIPTTIDDFKAQANILQTIHNELIKILGENGQMTATLQNVYTQLFDMGNNPESIAKAFNSLQTNITNLSEWLITVREQPMELDYLLVSQKDYEVPSGNSGFFQDAWFQVRMFVSSFFTDFNSISTNDNSTYSQEVKVWTTSARDQAQVLRNIIDRSFIGQYNINVNLELVPAGAILPSILANKGPDVILGLSAENVVNYAARNALEPLDDYEGFAEHQKKFAEAAFIPNSLEVEPDVIKHFGIPESQSFSVFPYRTDILEDLGKDVPTTWDECYSLIPILQKRYMEFAPPDFTTILYQNGGEYYRYNGQQVALDSEVAINSFIQQTDFYTLYKCPISFNFTNRFRNGEMPMGIQDLYGFYNLMSVFAPEIKGLWEFTIVPGTVKEDGSVDHTVVSSAASTCMLKSSQNKDGAWTFIKWFTDTQAQTDFGMEIESVLGAAGRYSSANKEAVANLNWTKAELDVIMEQWSWLVGNPEMPGAYNMNRYMGFATTQVIVEYADPRESLLDNIKPMNEDLILKRQELGLPLDKVTIN